MADLDVRIAVLEADHRSHNLSDDERYTRIDGNLTLMMTMLADIGRKMDDGLTREHDRLEIECARTRNYTDNAILVVDNKIAKVDKRITDLQAKWMASGITVLIAIIGFFVVPFFIKN